MSAQYKAVLAVQNIPFRYILTRRTKMTFRVKNVITDYI